MSQQAPSREGAKPVQEQGRLTRGRDFKWGSEDQLALVRNPGAQTRAPEIRGHWGCQESPHTCGPTVSSKASPAHHHPGLQATAPGSHRIPSIPTAAPGRGARPWCVGGDLGEDPAPFWTLSLHRPQEGESESGPGKKENAVTP